MVKPVKPIRTNKSNAIKYQALFTPFEIALTYFPTSSFSTAAMVAVRVGKEPNQ